MKLIVGLGNIGKKYENTRHNAGFDVVDMVASKLNVIINQDKFKAKVVSFNYKGEKVYLMKPTTFMNLSGEAIIEIVNFYKLQVEDLLVIHDDLDLPVGKIRIRKKGSAGGQNGMKNIQSHLHSQEIRRIKIGIGKDPKIAVVDYVLGKHRKEDLEEYHKSLDKASDAAIAFIDQDFEKVMNKYNQK